MTKQQVLWASGHDWFVRSVSLGDEKYAVVVLDRRVNGQTGECTESEEYFFDFSALREFAGY